MANPIGIAIQPHNDIALDGDGNLRMVAGAEAIGQHVRQRLMFWKGEWFLDRDVGVEWTRFALGRQAAAVALAEAEIKRVVARTPGVAAIVSIDVAYDRASRGLIVRDCRIQTDSDDLTDIAL